MRLGIETKYHGPTNYKGSRISASCDNCKKRTMVSYDHAFDSDGNHRQAALAHAKSHEKAAAELFGFDPHYTVSEEGLWTKTGAVFALLMVEEA